MDTTTIAKSKIGMLLIMGLAAGMESRPRYRFWGPKYILKGAGIQPGQSVLEVGCGTGYFTLPIIELIGEQGSLVAMDVLPESIELVSSKIKKGNLKNVSVIEGNALDTGLEAGKFDTVLLFGVIPAPMLPLAKLLPEMHRVLKAGGNLAVWPSVPGWLPHSISKSNLFQLVHKMNGVLNFVRT